MCSIDNVRRSSKRAARRPIRTLHPGPRPTFFLTRRGLSSQCRTPRRFDRSRRRPPRAEASARGRTPRAPPSLNTLSGAGGPRALIATRASRRRSRRRPRPRRARRIEPPPHRSTRPRSRLGASPQRTCCRRSRSGEHVAKGREGQATDPRSARRGALVLQHYGTQAPPQPNMMEQIAAFKPTRQDRDEQNTLFAPVLTTADHLHTA